MSVTFPIFKTTLEIENMKAVVSKDQPDLINPLDESCESSYYSEEDADSSSNKVPMKFDQSALNDLVRNLGLSKESSELLASRLGQRNLLLPGIKVTFYRNRDEAFRKYFTKEDSFVYCHDIQGLFDAWNL